LKLETKNYSLDDLTPYHKNPRAGDVDAIAESLKVNGQYKPIVVNLGTETGRPLEILAGNHTWQAAEQLGWSEIQAVTVDVDDAAATRIVLADNRTSDLAEYDDALLDELLASLDSLDGTGFTDQVLETLGAAPDVPETVRLVDRFGAAPLTVLSARAGHWQARKRLWLLHGLRSELGRDEALVYDSPQTRYINWYQVKNEAEEAAGRALSAKQIIDENLDKLNAVGEGTSVFDPALAELLVSWFSAPGMKVLDPWAGGSVRGVVSAVLGRRYTGIELRPEQIAANVAQLPVVERAVKAGLGLGDGDAVWVEDDALAGLDDESFDMVLSAPPKYGLHRGGEPADFTPDLTPVEKHGDVWVKREDAWSRGGASGAKSRAMFAVAEGSDGLITAGSRISPQIERGALVARALGIPARVHTSAGEPTPITETCERAGAEVLRHSPGYKTVYAKRFADDAAAHPSWAAFPFGMNHPVYREQVAAQVANLPADALRVVVPVGSGMTLAGVLEGLAAADNPIEVLGVSVGGGYEATLDEHFPAWRDRVTIVDASLDYEQAGPVDALPGLRLDPMYEAKCVEFLKPGDVLWAVGIREDAKTASADMVPPTWIEGDSTERLRDLDAASYDLAFGCPPYYDLENYSDDPRDLSNLTAEEFDAAMAATVKEIARVLRDDSFAVFVVGAVRDPEGYILDMRACMSAAARAAGLRLVNDAVLLTPVGSAAVRAARGFRSRTLSRVHQEVLVYVKGDRKAAAARCGDIEEGAAFLPVPDDGVDEDSDV